jgi:hypothetical protein
MRVIDRKKLFAAFAHLTLSSEEIIRGRFVSHVRIGRHVTKRVNASCLLLLSTTNQAATFSWICFNSVGQQLVAV